MTITGGSALPKDDIERMMKDAEVHASEDRQRREEAEIRNNADSLVYQTEKFLAENAEKLTEGEAAEKKSETEGALNELKESLKGSDTAAIKSATEKVSTLSQSLGAAMYAANASAPAGESENKGHGDDDVVDAEIVDDQK